MLRHSFNHNWTFRKGTDRFFGPGSDAAVPVTLPHDAMILEARDPNTPNSNASGFYPGGVYTYEKRFQVPAEDNNKDIYIEFEAIYMNATVTINGNVAANRPYGYSPILIKANEYLCFGQENVVKVVVRNDAMPNSRWYTGSGIYRDTWLMTADQLHVTPDGLRIVTHSADDDLAVVEIAVTIENTGHASRTASLDLEIRDGDGIVAATDNSPFTAFPGETMTLRRRLSVAKARLWSPDQPNLYNCACAINENNLLVDESSSLFGIRTLSLDTVRGLRINGQTVKLRGTCIHHDNGVIGAATLPRAEERRAEIMKQAGFNAIRSAHNPLSKTMLEACDRLGMLVMDESFDMWQQSKSTYDYAVSFDDWWERDIEAMVAKDFNHPSVILYSIGNEIPEAGTVHGAKLNRIMTEKVRSLDPTRYVTNGVNGIFAAMPHLKEIVEELREDGLLPAETATSGAASEINQFMMNIFQDQDKYI